jgi:hypothetical protein
MSENLFNFASFLGILILVFYLFRINRISFRTSHYLPFVWLVIFSTFYEFFLYDWFRLGSIVWFRVYGLLEFFTIFYYFYKLIRGYRIFFMIILILYLILFLLLLFRWKFITPLQSDSYLISVEVILVFVSSTLWFKQLFKDFVYISLFLLSDFYIVSGLILFFSGTLTLELLSSSIFKSITSEFLVYWNLIIVFNIVLRLLILVGIWKQSKL